MIEQLLSYAVEKKLAERLAEYATVAHLQETIAKKLPTVLFDDHVQKFQLAELSL
jgi:hypothetical protein